MFVVVKAFGANYMYTKEIHNKVFIFCQISMYFH